MNLVVSLLLFLSCIETQKYEEKEVYYAKEIV